jgi:hypothetical protein
MQAVQMQWQHKGSALKVLNTATRKIRRSPYSNDLVQSYNQQRNAVTEEEPNVNRTNPSTLKMASMTQYNRNKKRNAQYI